MRRKRIWRAGVALLLCTSMLFQSTESIGVVRAEELAEEEALAQSLLGFSEQYPEGGVTFAVTQLVGTEGERLELTILRQGNRDQEAKVSLKAVDVSALYGKDYLMTVKDGGFLSETLRGDVGNQTLLEQYGVISEDEAAEAEKAQEQQMLEETKETGETPAEEPQPEGAEETEETEETGEAPAEEPQPEGAEETEETEETGEAPAEEPLTEGTEETEETADSSVKEQTTAAPQENEEEPAAEQEAVSEQENEVLPAKEPGAVEEINGGTAYLVPEGKSPLQAARDIYLNQDSVRTDWRTVEKTDERYEELYEMAEKSQEEIENFADLIAGVGYTFTFAPGEYKKVIEIQLIDDTLSEAEEQVMFLLYQAENVQMGDYTTAYLNIQDNEEQEEQIFEVDATDVYVSSDEGYAEITVRRTSGLMQFATVYAGTAGDTAMAGIDYTETQTELVFAQGETEKTIKVPLLAEDVKEEEKIFYVGLKAKGGQIAENQELVTVHIIEAGEIALFASRASTDDWENIGNVKTDKVSANGGNSSSSIQIAEKLSLSLADTVTVNVTSNEGERNWTTGSGCSKESHNSKEAKITIEIRNSSGTVVQSTEKKRDNFFSNQDMTITLNDAAQCENASIWLKIQNVGENDASVAKANSAKIHYPTYTYFINNSEVLGQNVYIEQWYGYGKNQSPAKTKAKMKLGSLNFTGATDIAGTEVAYRKTNAAPTINTVLNTEAKNSLGIAVSEDNTYLKGVRLVNGQAKSELLQPEDIVFNKEFIKKYSQYLNTKTMSFSIYPIFEVKSANVYLADTGTGDNTYDYSSGNKQSTIECKALDVVRIAAFPGKQGKDIQRIEVGDTGSYSIATDLETNIREGKGRDYKEEGKSCFAVWNINYTWKDLNPNLIKRNAVKPEEIELSPCGNVFVYVQVEAPQLQVYALKKGGTNLDSVWGKDENGNPIEEFKGSVLYAPKDGTPAAGNPKIPMTILGVTKFQPLTISSITQEGYKTRWYERTGDLDENGVVTTEELMALGDGYMAMTPVSGNILTYTPKLSNTILCYDFMKVDPAECVPVEGILYIQDTEMMTGKAVKKRLSGATITINTTTDKTDEKGYYCVEDPSLTASDYAMVAVNYKGVSFSFIQNPGFSKLPVLDAYTGIKRVQATLASRNPENHNEMQVISPNSEGNISIPNDNWEYIFTMTVRGESASVQPTKAVLRFYKKDGTSYGQDMETTQMVVEGLKNSGQFQFIVNPGNISQDSGSPVLLEPGSYMTVQFFDQNGIGYYEHEIGVKVTKSMGLVDFMNSFKITASAGDLLGNINSAFDMNWGGDLEHSSFVMKETLTDEKTLEQYDALIISTSDSFGSDDLADSLGKVPLGGIAGAARDKGKADQELADANWALRDASEAYAKETDPDKKKKLEKDVKKKKKAVEDATKEAKDKEDKYKEAVEKSDKKKTTKVTLAVNADIGLSYAMTIQLNYDNEKEQYYFKEMMLSAKVTAGVNLKFVFATPIGLDVIVTVGVSVGESSIMLQVSQRADQRVYISEWGEETESGTRIDLFNSDMDDEDRQLDFFGQFVIQPTLDLSGDVGFSLISTSVGVHAKAKFDLQYYANEDETHQDSQYLYLTGGFHISILGKKISWDYGLDPIDLSGKSRSVALMSAMSDDSALYESVDNFTIEDRSYLNERSEWQSGAASVSLFSTRAVSSFQEQILRSGNYTSPDVQMANLGNGRILAVYLDVDPSRTVAENQTAVYYTIYDGVIWSEPVLLENDGKLDDSPVIADMGDRGVMVAWSAADREFVSGENLLTMLSSRNIHTAVFDKNHLTFGAIQEATRTTGEDVCADVEPKISYFKYGNEERMLMYYAKNEYEATDNENGVVGDAIYPYSLMAYLFYDFETGEWRHTYTETEKQAIISSGAVPEGAFAQYEANWYGQGFLNLPPALTLNEELDENGYWKTVPTITPAVSEQNLGIVTDCDTITYNGLALFAYVLDKDGSRSTSSDRDIYLQIYDYEGNRFLHPIIVTSNDVEESNVKLVRSEQGTLLAYLSEQKISVLNISQILNNEAYILAEGTQPVYYVKKTQDSGYMPPHIIQSYQDTLTEEEMDGNAGRSISNFNIHTNEDGSVTYVLWTESAPMLKDGVDPHSEEAKLEENQSTQIQIYGSRLKDGRWSGRTQITEAEAVYGNLDFTVNEAGNLVILASKNEVEEEAAGLERNGCDLVNILAAPDEKIALDKLTLSEVMEGENGGSVIVKNEGFVDAKNVQLVIKDQDGEEILTKQFDTLYSGQSEECYFSLNLPEGTANWKVTAELKSGGITEDKIEREGEIPLNVTLDTLTLKQEERRDMVTAELHVTNASAITVNEQNAVISEEAGGAALASVKIPKLAPGEATVVTAEVPIRDEMFAVYTDSEAGELSAEETGGDTVEKLTLYAVADYTGTVSGSIERRTSAKDLEYIQSITDIILQNGEKVKVNAGEYQTVKVDIQSPLMKYDEFTTYRNYNLEVLWRTEDPDIVQVDENGILKGIKEGKTTLTAIVKPRGNEVWLEEGVNGKEVDNTLSLTSDALKIAAVEVEVLQGTQENGGTTPSDNAGAEKQPGNETTGSKQAESEATANVKTGDTAQPFLWLIMIAASGCLILVVSRKRKMR